MSKKLKKLGKVAAGLGAAYALSQMGKSSGTDTGTLDTEQETYLEIFQLNHK
jgi:hypothetical protein